MPSVYRSILVPLDGSSFAEQALPLAAAIAQRSNAILQLALVHHPVPALALAVEAPEIGPQLDHEAHEQERTYLDGVVERLHTSKQIPVTGVILDGPVADALEEHIAGTGADLVVSTTHGRGPLGRVWLGSVADSLMRRLRVPLVLIRPSEHAHSPGPDSIQKILITLDGSPFAEQVLPEATALGRLCGASYALLFVVEPPGTFADPTGLMVLPGAPEVERLLRDQAGEYLNRTAGRLRAEGLEVSTHLVEGPVVVSTIQGQAEELGADLIALATHGAGGVERLMTGSVADKVIRGATRPILVVRPATH
jgi:nucleotide-binding universal stress UspA family protein